MNENLNLVEILKDCPIGTKLYSTIHGDVKLELIDDPAESSEIGANSRLRNRSLTRRICNHLIMVLVRNAYYSRWICNFYSHEMGEGCEYKYDSAGSNYKYCIPYNDDTKHLVGTTEEAPEYYRYWED